MDNPGTILAALLLLSVHAASSDCILSTIKHSQEECIGSIECSTTVSDLNQMVTNWPCLRQRTYACVNIYSCPAVPSQFTVQRFSLKIKFVKTSDSVDYFYRISQFIENVVSMTVTNGDITFIPLQLFAMEKLAALEVSHNKIETIDLSNSLSQDRLQVFNASFNLIAKLETSVYDRLISNMSVLDLSHNAMNFIPDNYFNKFPHLLHINMSHNVINSFNILTFEGLSKLETLYLSYNHIKEIELVLARFSSLKELTLDHNELSSIGENDFKMLSSLVMLDLSFNKIISVDKYSFQNMRSLTHFLVNNNNVKVISKSMFIDKYALQEVNFANNKIYKIDPFSFKGTNITLCKFRNNSLTALDDKSIFEGINEIELDLSISNIHSLGENVFIELRTQLRKLNLSTNSISHIHKYSFRGLALLHELDLSNNELQNIEFNMSDLTSLFIFNAENNSISKITKDAFRHIKSLKRINLSNNDITNIEAFAFIDLEELDVLDLTSNNLPIVIAPNMFNGLLTTYKFQLMHTKITTLQNGAFYSMTDLNYLNASNGDIKIIEYNVFNGTKNIWILDLSHNRLETFTVNNTYLEYVREIYLNDNLIESIKDETFADLIFLEKINLDHNNILHISIDAFQTLRNISSLYLSSNVNMMLDTSLFSNISKLTYIGLNDVWKPFNFKNAKNISIPTIDLSSDNITDINSLMIYQLTKLETLLLNSNKIRYIDRFSFQNMSSLTILDLSNNMISTIKPGSFVGTHRISTLNLHNNNLASLTFGVFDGLRNLHILNLSSNVIHNFQSRIFHNNHWITVISLDNNIIDDIDLKELKAAAIPKITIGGNLIPCDVLVSWENKKFYDITVTSEKLNYHVENVDGISCQGSLTETSTVQDVISKGKTEPLKMADIVENRDADSSTFQVINRQLDTLKSALYFEAACLLIIVCLLLGIVSFVSIKLRSSLGSSNSMSRRHLAVDSIEME